MYFLGGNAQLVSIIVLVLLFFQKLILISFLSLWFRIFQFMTYFKIVLQTVLYPSTQWSISISIINAWVATLYFKLLPVYCACKPVFCVHYLHILHLVFLLRSEWGIFLFKFMAAASKLSTALSQKLASLTS